MRGERTPPLRDTENGIFTPSPSEDEQLNNGEQEKTAPGEWTRYRDTPEQFALEVLGSHWWKAQREVAEALCHSRRVAVKAANGVGKTFLAADLVLWFLYSHPGSVVLTTAPTWRQVEALLWREVRRRHCAACYRAERKGTPILAGKPLQTQLKLEEGHFAMGLSTDEPVRFQGFHAENLLVILDEACGIRAEIWDAVEGICVGKNNRVLALSNPLGTDNRFYQLFSNPGWHTLTISALDHPNVTGANAGEEEDEIPGAVTPEAIEDRIMQWCEPAAEGEAGNGSIIWNEKRYCPNGLFRARVLGEFPAGSEDSLLSRDWIEAAQTRSSPVSTPCALAVDVARFGADETAFALRRGDRIEWIRTVRGQDTMVTAQTAAQIARQEKCDLVLVDETGVGGGVYDRIGEAGVRGLIGVQFGGKTQGLEGDRYQNLKAQLFWRLREALREGRLCLPADTVLTEQLACLRYNMDEFGHIRLERKEELRRRGIASPDRADAVAMLMHPALDAGAKRAVSVSSLDWRSEVNW